MAPRVAIARGSISNIEADVRRAVTLAGGLEELIKKDSRVLIKPNLCEPAPSGSGVVTNARVTEAVTKMVLELGPKSVVIGDGSVVGYDMPGKESRNSADLTAFRTEDVFEISGTLEVANRLGVELRNLNRDSFEEVTVPHPNVMEKVRIARTALESDVLISLPVLKTHIRTLVTLSLKNMKGVMPGSEKRKTHRLGLDLAIADLNSVVRPSYAVLDATVGIEGLWQYPQDSQKMGLVIAGRDALSVDIVGTSLMGIDPNKIMHLCYIAQQEKRTVALEQIELVGEPLENHVKHFKSGFQALVEKYPGVHLVQGKSACSGCTNELVGVLRSMKEAGYGQNMENLTIIIGDPGEPEVTEKVVVLGKCAKELKQLGTYEAGCPPKEDNMVRVLCEACHADAKQVIAARDEARHKLWESFNTLFE